MKKLISTFTLFVLVMSSPMAEKVQLQEKIFYYVIEASPNTSVKFVKDHDSTEEYSSHEIQNLDDNSPQYYLNFTSNEPGNHVISFVFTPFRNTGNSSVIAPCMIDVLDAKTFAEIFTDVDLTKDENITESDQVAVAAGGEVFKQYAFVYDFLDVEQSNLAGGTYNSTITVIIDGGS